jgi:hypothetical protein
MDIKKETLNIVQGLMEVVRMEQSLREAMQSQINKLVCEVAELRTKVDELRAK